MKQKASQYKSYFTVFVLGLAAGIITRCSDFFSADTLWSFSSIATLFGFWILTTALIVYHSHSNLNAGINAFLYLFSMSLSFYLLEYLLGLFLPRFDNDGFKFSLFGLYAALSLLCGLVSFFLYSWNKGNKIGSVLYALPVGGLFAEALGVGVYLFSHGTFLFQFIFDLVGGVALGWFFCKKAANRLLYMAVCVLTAAIGYLVFYRPFL